MDRIRKEMERGAGFEHTAYKNELDTWRNNEADARYERYYAPRRDDYDPYRERRNFQRDPREDTRLRFYDRRRERNYDERRDDRHERFGNRRDDRDRRDYRYEEPSYISTIRNYHPRGGRPIERSQMGEDEMRRSNLRRNPAYHRPYDYDEEVRNYNREDDYRW